VALASFRVYAHSSCSWIECRCVASDSTGRWSERLFRQIYRLMAMGGDELPPLPPMTLVGIDRAPASGVQVAVTRFFDLPSTSVHEVEEGLSSAFGTTLTTEGAYAFPEILKGEIIPWVEARYPAGSERAPGGYSFGGLFATHALLTSPETFTHYWIGSPSFWWDGGVKSEREEAYSAEFDMLDARVFMSAG